MATGHAHANYESNKLCDYLNIYLSKKIPGLERKQSEGWCGFSSAGRIAFAYIDHRKKMPKIDIWCLGDITAFSGYTNLQAQTRNTTRGGFGTSFKCHFFVDNVNIVTASEALLQVSYPLSIR